MRFSYIFRITVLLAGPSLLCAQPQQQYAPQPQQQYAQPQQQYAPQPQQQYAQPQQQYGQPQRGIAIPSEFKMAGSAEPTMLTKKELNKHMNAFIKKKGLRKNFFTDKNGYDLYVNSAKSSVAVDPNHPNYMNAREIAFQEALMSAKRKLTESLGVKIGQSLKSSLAKPSQERQKADFEEAKRQGLLLQSGAGIANVALQDGANAATAGYSNTANAVKDKSQVLLENELAKKLSGLGLDPNKPIDEQTLNRVINSKDFQRSIEATAKTLISGVQVIKTFEVIGEGDNGTIGIVIAWSNRLAKLAGSMFSGTSSLAPFDKPGKPLEQSIPQDDATLLGTFGVQFKRNERSEWCLLSYGQSAATDDGDVAGEIAAEESELNAQGMMRGFAGEMAVAAKNKKDSQSSKQLSDKSNQYKYDSSFFRSMETNSEAKLITGFFTLHEWQATHPTSQQEVFGSVVAWCPSNMDTARRVQKSMQDSQKNRPNTQQQNPQQQYTPQPHGAYYGGGAEADSDF